MKKDYRKMFNILDEYLKNRVEDIDTTILEAVEARKNGKIFSFEEHLKGLIFSQLSGSRNWKYVHRNIGLINEIFFNFDKEKIKDTGYEYFVDRLKSYKLGGRSLNAQMQSLKYNIEILEKIEKEYGALDAFVTRLKPKAIAFLLSNKEGSYKLKQTGFPLAMEYLRNIGIDEIKPDVHLIRIFKRMGLIPDTGAEQEVIQVAEKLSNYTGFSKAYIDFLLWHFCAEGYGNICSASPKCAKCPIAVYCDFNKNIKMAVIKTEQNRQIKNNYSNASEKIKSLKHEFKNYLISKYPNTAKSTIDTYLGDAFYVFRHQHLFKTDFFDLFKSLEDIKNFQDEILTQQKNGKIIKNPKGSAGAYINGIKRLYNFFIEKYNGVDNFINS